jgi:hypothetical protein
VNDFELIISLPSHSLILDFADIIWVTKKLNS